MVVLFRRWEGHLSVVYLCPFRRLRAVDWCPSQRGYNLQDLVLHLVDDRSSWFWKLSGFSLLIRGLDSCLLGNKAFKTLPPQHAAPVAKCAGRSANWSQISLRAGRALFLQRKQSNRRTDGQTSDDDFLMENKWAAEGRWGFCLPFHFGDFCWSVSKDFKCVFFFFLWWHWWCQFSRSKPYVSPRNIKKDHW